MWATDLEMLELQLLLVQLQLLPSDVLLNAMFLLLEEQQQGWSHELEGASAWRLRGGSSYCDGLETLLQQLTLLHLQQKQRRQQINIWAEGGGVRSGVTLLLLLLLTSG